MARRRAGPTNTVVLGLAITVALMLVGYPVVGAIVWWRTPARSADVIVYNTTNPTDDLSQQRAIDLVVEHLKIEGTRFVGADPGGLDVGRWPSQAPDAVFLVDAYGVYLDDVSLDPGAAGTTLLTRPLGDPVAPDLEAWSQAGTFVYGEFNILHPPTPPDVSERFQALFGVDALGWVGRWYADLAEVGENLQRLSREPWPTGGQPGLVLVAQSVGTVSQPEQIVVITGDDLGEGPPMITGTGIDGRPIRPTPMLDWFSLMESTESADVAMWLDLPINRSAADALTGLGVTARTPMLIIGDNTAYFAGNVSRTGAAFPTRRLAWSLDVMRLLPQSDQAAGFYRVVGPTMRWILEET